MRVATFGADEALVRALEASGPAEMVRCPPGSPDSGELPRALEAAEAALESAGAQAALIAGAGDWELAAALACAKAVVPFAHVSGEADRENGNAGHIERLAMASIGASDGPAAVQRWLAALGD